MQLSLNTQPCTICTPRTHTHTCTQLALRRQTRDARRALIAACVEKESHATPHSHRWWAHSAVDYMAAAVGGDRREGWMGERVVGNPPCAGSTGGNCVCMAGPSGDWCACPHTAPSHSTTHPPSSPTQCHPPTHIAPHTVPLTQLPHTTQLPPTPPTQLPTQFPHLAPPPHVHTSEC